MYTHSKMRARTTNPTIRCATSDDLDQSAHPRSVMSLRMCLLQPAGYPKKDKQEPLSYCGNIRLTRVFAGHKGLVGFLILLLKCHTYYVINVVICT